jgi:hypothetical protein
MYMHHFCCRYDCTGDVSFSGGRSHSLRVVGASGTASPAAHAVADHGFEDVTAALSAGDSSGFLADRTSDALVFSASADFRRAMSSLLGVPSEKSNASNASASASAAFATAFAPLATGGV